MLCTCKMNNQQFTLCSSNFKTNSKISANCFTNACCFSKCSEGDMLPEHNSERILGTTVSIQEKKI